MHAQKMDSDTSKKLAEVLANTVPARIPSGNLKDNAAFVASPKDDVAETPPSPPPSQYPQWYPKVYRGCQWQDV